MFCLISMYQSKNWIDNDLGLNLYLIGLIVLGQGLLDYRFGLTRTIVMNQLYRMAKPPFIKK